MDSIIVEKILKEFEGLVIIDEAYQDFSGVEGWLPRLNEFENLVILQTFSKAWGMAALRLGMAFAHPYVIGVLSKIKYPYNINELTQKTVLKALENTSKKDVMLREIIAGRKYLMGHLTQIPNVQKVFPSDANFILVKFNDPQAIYKRLQEKKVIVRDRSGLVHCNGCLRFTVGTKKENEILIEELKKI
jgi:histidinol-phosphate aminotransferase